jgi:hypothetical protein
VEAFVQIDRVVPGEQGWVELCKSAERLIDLDSDRYDAALPAVRAALAGWPAALRRCPDRWFRTPRPGPGRLLLLGGATPADLDDRAPLLDDGSQSVSGVTDIGRWTVFAQDLEFDLDGDVAGPDHAAVQVAAFVFRNWSGFAHAAVRVLAGKAVARGPQDPYQEGEVPAGVDRFEPTGMVTVEATVPGFHLHCYDNSNRVNQWPYGHWMVDFEWGRAAGVRVGTFEYNYPI